MFGQTSSSVWTDVNPADIPVTRDRWITNDKFRAVKTDVKVLKELLKNVPMEYTPEAKTKAVLFEIPTPDGRIKHYSLVESPIMETKFAAEHPEIKTYGGKGVENPFDKVRLDITPNGFHAMIISFEGTYFIDPYSFGNTEYYISYHMFNFPLEGNLLECETSELTRTIDNISSKKLINGIPQKQKPEEILDCKLRTYRLAVAATSEFTSLNGGKSLTLSTIVEKINRVNNIYKNELGIFLLLINNMNIIYDCLPSEDPYDNYDIVKMYEANQKNLDKIDVLGSNNYDIGFVLSTYGAGKAVIGSICNPLYKAQGAFGGFMPGIKYPQDFLSIAHEIGHMFSAYHTWGDCETSEKKSFEYTAVEPGAGTTVMAYPIHCQSKNILTNDLSFLEQYENQGSYFHGASISQIKTFLSGLGGTCANNSNILNLQISNNKAPTVIISSIPDQFIPKSTPFFLSAKGKDVNDNKLVSYCWEEMDRQVESFNIFFQIVPLYPQPPQPTSKGGPNFRSFPPISDSIRFFPSLDNIIKNVPSKWEVIPSVKRILNFRVVVRDNDPSCGCTAVSNNLSLNVDDKSGPFLVTYPNYGISLPGGSLQTVTWDKANTDFPPVSCSKVDILLSTDGGYTYPVMLASAVKNIGVAKLTIPNISTSVARIMIRGTERVFFDISDNNFSISLTCNAPIVNIPTITQPSFTIPTGTIKINSTGSGPLEFSINNGNTWQALAIFSGLPAGNYFIKVRLKANPDCLSSYGQQVIINSPPSNKLVLICPPNITVSCFNNIPDRLAVINTEKNYCSNVANVYYSVDNVTPEGKIKATINRIYFAANICNDSATCSHIIKLVDTASVSINCPPNVNILCIENVPQPDIGSVIASYNCDSLPSINFVSDISISGNCINKLSILRTYMATDLSGKSKTCSYKITVNDIIPPSLTCPANITVSNAINIPIPNINGLVEIDNCSELVTKTFVSDVISSQSSPNSYILARTYRGNDVCGNITECIQTINVGNCNNCPVNVHCPDLIWAKKIGGLNEDRAFATTVDIYGNVYTTGDFSGTVDFDPGPGINNMTAFSSHDIFISKLDSNGSFLWAKQMGGAYNNRGNSIFVDINSNVYTTGWFSGKGDFDPGPGIFTMGYNEDADANIFVSKLDALGGFLWAKAYSSQNTDVGTSVKVDENGNVYVSSVGYPFLLKYDFSGKLLWSKYITAFNGFVYNTSIAIDPFGNIYSTGTFNGSFDFDPGPGSFYMSSDPNYGNIFILKLNAAGNFVWAKQIGGTSFVGAASIAVDENSNVFITGAFAETSDFNPGSGIYNLISEGSTDSYVLKLDPIGNFLWVKQLKGIEGESENCIRIDKQGFIFTGGTFAGTTDFDPGPLNYNLTSSGHNDCFISKLDPSGNFVWAKQLGGVGDEPVNSIEIDTKGNIYSTGYFQGTSDFDPDTSIYNMNAVAGSSDIFIVKLRQECNCANPTITNQPLSQTIYIGNTATFNISANSTSAYTFQWYKNNSLIPGATNSFYTTPMLKIADSGSQYYCIVSNCSGSKNVTSNKALLTVTTTCTGISISKQPTNQAVKVGAMASFSVVANGTAPLSYQWLRDNIVISGAIGSSYTTPIVALGDNGKKYQCKISNCLGKVVASNNVTLTVTNASTTSKIANNSNTSINPAIPKSNSLNDPYGDNNRKGALKVFPNPNNGEFTLQLETSIGEPIQIKVYNEYNQEVYSNQEYSTENTYSKLISLKEKSSGIYFLRVITSNENYINKVILTK